MWSQASAASGAAKAAFGKIEGTSGTPVFSHHGRSVRNVLRELAVQALEYRRLGCFAPVAHLVEGANVTPIPTRVVRSHRDHPSEPGCGFYRKTARIPAQAAH